MCTSELWDFKSEPFLAQHQAHGFRVKLPPRHPDGRLETGAEANLALVAASSTSYVSGHETITALNDGSTPENSKDKSHGACGNWPRTGTQWVQYDWTKPISTKRMEVYWFDDHNGVRLTKACRLKYWAWVGPFNRGGTLPGVPGLPAYCRGGFPSAGPSSPTSGGRRAGWVIGRPCSRP